VDYAAVVALEILYMIAFLALTSAGLAIVFGMMRVINLAHGELVMLGGYTTLTCYEAGVNIYVAILIISPVVVGIIGMIIEKAVIQFLYGRVIDTMLATWGVSLILVGLVSTIFGTSAMSVPAPISGYTVGEFRMGGYNLFIIFITAIIYILIYFILRFTRAGLIARGAMESTDIASSMGYNPKVIYTVTFTVGAALSGMAGGILAPLTGLLPSSGGAYIAKAFITVITGGIAAITGTTTSSVLFGTINQIFSFAYNPVVGEIAMLIFAVIILRLLPSGITGKFFKSST
jgi:urea transport system permease protein